MLGLLFGFGADMPQQGPAHTTPQGSVAKPAEKQAGQAPGDAKKSNQSEPRWNKILKDHRLGPWTLDVGGSLRYRYEHQENFNAKRYADPAFSSDDFLLQRFRLDFDLHLDKHLRTYVQFQDARPFGVNFSKSDFMIGCPYWDYFDLREAYVERLPHEGAPLGFKIGRQAIFYADNRVWGPGEWGNVGRYTWDAVKIMLHVQPADVHFIFGERVRYDSVRFDGDHHQFHAYGVYAMLNNLPWRVDLFYLKKESHGNYVVGPHGETLAVDANTFGLYLDGKLHERWDFGGTFAHTFGMHQHRGLEAYGANARLGYTFDWAWKPRIGFDFSYGSGDPSPASGRHQTFDGLFGAVDRVYGRMNLFSWMNLQDYQTSLSIKPAAKLDIRLDWHYFRLDKAQDAWYYCNGRVQRHDPTGAAGTDLGHELDLVAKYKRSECLRFQAGYAHFFPGLFMQRTGPSPDADWVFVQGMLRY